MGMYPRQEFIYGIGIDEEVDFDWEKVEMFCDKNNFDYVFGGDYGGSWNSGLVIGRKRSNFLYSCNATPEGKYVGGYHVAEFNLANFIEWFANVRYSFTDHDIDKINNFLKIKKEPKLYTVSTRQ